MIVAFALALSVDAAQTTPEIPDPPKCWDGSQRELNSCAYKEYQQADTEMNVQWAKTSALMKRLDADVPPNDIMGRRSQAEALLKGQRAWLSYRDAHCFIFGDSGGTMAPMLEYICLRDITRARTEELESMMVHPATGNPYFEDQ